MKQPPTATPDEPETRQGRETKAPETGGAKGLLKTVLPEPSAEAVGRGSPPAESKTRRVAKFLILVGSEQAAKILGELDDQQVGQS
jgi:hypothetical protein